MTRPTRMTAGERERYRRSRQLFERGEVESALEELEPLIESHGEFADLHYMRGVLLDRKGEIEAAATSLRQAIRLNPNYSEALLALASVSERNGDFQRSRELIERASQAGRRSAGPLDGITRAKLANVQAAVGDAYAECGEPREAIEAYRKALHWRPDFLDIRQRLALALRSAGLVDRAVQEFQRVLQTDPDYQDARVQLGVSYYSLGRPTEARAQWEAALERDPEHRHARMYLRLLASGRSPT